MITERILMVQEKNKKHYVDMTVLVSANGDKL